MSASSGPNEQLMRRFCEEVWHKGNVDFAEGGDLRSTEPLPGLEGQKQVAAAFRAAFPDLSFNVDLAAVTGSTWQPGGRRRGPTLAMGRAAADGNSGPSRASRLRHRRPHLGSLEPAARR